MELSNIQERIVQSDKSQVLVLAAAASGKAQPDYTIIPTPSGYKRMDELAIGDYVFDRYGKPTRVLGIFPQGKKQIYEVELADKRIVECCEDHLWSYNNSHNGLTTKSLKEMYESGWKRKEALKKINYKYRIPTLKNPVQYNYKPVSIDPYTLGCFIGDGCCLEADLTISSNDEELVKTIADINNFKYQKNSRYNYSWTFFNEKGKIKTKDFFSKYEKEMVRYCGEKSIPIDYLVNSYEVRLSLLQGLMDTDGTTGNGRNSPQYSTTSKTLAYNVEELCRSLGFYTTVYVQNRLDKKSVEYTVNIFTGNENTYKIFNLSRKKNKCLEWKEKKQRINHKFVSIIDIRPTERYTSMRCILVDNSEHLYLTNNFVVTHNTKVLTERVKYLLNNGISPEKIVVFTFTNAAALEMKERIGGIGKGTFIGTIHSYANSLLLSHGIDTAGAISEERFDDFFDLIKKNPECIKEVEHLLLDEAQDSSILHFEFIFDMIHPRNYFLCGDIRQSIYAFSGGYPDKLIDLMDDPFVTTYELNENYRNGPKILDYARNFINKMGYPYTDTSICMRKDINDIVIEKEFSLPEVLRLVSTKDNYGSWFILTRTNAQLDYIYDYLNEHDVPCDTFKRAQLTTEELAQKMKDNTVKVLTIHTSKGLESDNVIVYGARKWSQQAEERRISYVAMTRAKNVLIWMKSPSKKKRQFSSWE